MKVDLKETSNGQLRSMRDGLDSFRSWFGGFKEGRHEPGKPPLHFAWEDPITRVRILIDALIQQTNPKDR